MYKNCTMHCTSTGLKITRSMESNCTMVQMYEYIVHNHKRNTCKVTLTIVRKEIDYTCSVYKYEDELRKISSINVKTCFPYPLCHLLGANSKARFQRETACESRNSISAGSRGERRTWSTIR